MKDTAGFPFCYADVELVSVTLNMTTHPRIEDDKFMVYQPTQFIRERDHVANVVHYPRIGQILIEDVRSSHVVSEELI